MATRQTFFMHRPTREQAPWRHRLYLIIFESDTRGGRIFDIALLIAIGISIAVVLMESVEPFREAHPNLLRDLEWTFTILFTIEYIARLLCVRRPWRYAFSFYGVIDLLAFLPSYIDLITPSPMNYLLMIRVLRLLRVFRILKLAHYLKERDILVNALRSSRQKITVFICTVLAIVFIVGTLMYLIEGPGNGFDSIPRSVYWAIVTITTVGYGDITPHTILGRILACFVMLLGYGIIAVPTGIFAVELQQASRDKPGSRTCDKCQTLETDVEARFCRRCGEALSAT